MQVEATKTHPLLGQMVERLEQSTGDALVAVVLYGSAARGDFQGRRSDFNLLVVLRDLEPATLERLTDPIRFWNRQGQPVPRLFSPALIAEATDVFPIEFLDLLRARVVLSGSDPLAGVEVHRHHLRVQCERELREKMMRLREAYVAGHDRPRELEQLLIESFTTFVALFRGCLFLLGGEVPIHNEDVVAAFCRRAGLDTRAFDAVAGLKRGERTEVDLETVFRSYYSELTRAVDAVDRFRTDAGGENDAR